MSTKSRTKTFLFRTSAIFIIIILALVALPALPAYAAACTFTSAATGSWGTAGTWSAVGVGCGTYPGSGFAGDTVIIASGNIVTLNVSPTNAIASLTVTGTLTSTATQTLNVTGNVAGTGVISGPGSGTGTTIVFGGDWTFSGTGPNGSTSSVSPTANGSVNQTLNGNFAFRTITINKSGGTLFITGSLTFSSAFTLTAGNVNYSAAADQSVLAGTYPGNLTLSGSGTKTSAGVITVDSNLVVGDGVTFSHGASSLTVTGTTTIGGGTSGNLTLTSTSGTKTFVGLVTVNPGATWDDSINEAVTLRGGLTNNGTFIAGTAVYTFNTNNQALTGIISIPKVTVTGVTLTNNNALTVGTALAGNGGLTQAAGSTLNIGGTSTVTTLTATAAGNTVNYYGAVQTVKTATYDNVVFSGSGAKKVATGTSINENLSVALSGSATASINAGLNISAGTLTLGGLGRINGEWGSTSSAAT